MTDDLVTLLCPKCGNEERVYGGCGDFECRQCSRTLNSVDDRKYDGFFDEIRDNIFSD